MSQRILFAPDSGALVGGGHVMRGLTLAAALQGMGAVCSFLVGPEGRRLVETFGPPEAEVFDLGDGAPKTIGQALAGLAGDFDAVVIDNYRLDAAQEAPVAARGVRIVVVDDLADRAHRCDLLIDSSFARRGEDYAGLTGEGCVVLAGVAYAPLRPGFAAVRPRAQARRDGRPVERALVSLGLTDLGGVTARVVETVLPLLGDIRLDVVVGEGARSLERLKALGHDDPRIRLHVDATDVERLMLEADAAIGAGGSTTWERACLGLPSLTVVLADNQGVQSRALAERGMILAVDARSTAFDDDLVAGWGRLVGDAELRRSMSRQTMALCDGRGAQRVAGAILALG